MAVINGWMISPHSEPANGKKDLVQRLEMDQFKPALDLFPSRQFERVPELDTSEGIPFPLPAGATELRLVPISALYLGRTPEQNRSFVIYVK